jgi:hypothetical protein
MQAFAVSGVDEGAFVEHSKVTGIYQMFWPEATGALRGCKHVRSKYNYGRPNRDYFYIREIRSLASRPCVDLNNTKNSTCMDNR